MANIEYVNIYNPKLTVLDILDGEFRFNQRLKRGMDVTYNDIKRHFNEKTVRGGDDEIYTKDNTDFIQMIWR